MFNLNITFTQYALHFHASAVLLRNLFALRLLSFLR